MRRLALFLVILLNAGPARADDAARARAAFQRGVAAYTAGRVSVALDAFREAYRIKPNPVVLYNIGQAEAEMGKPALAIAHFEQYLREAHSISPGRRAEVKAEIVKLKGKAGKIELDSSVSGARVAVDGAAVGTTPLGRPILVEPGRHHVAVTREGFEDYTTEVTLSGGESVRLTAKLASSKPAEAPVAMPAPVPPAPPQPPGEEKIPEPPAEARTEAPKPGLVEVPELRPMAPPQDNRDVPLAEQPAQGGISRKWFWTGVGVTTVLLASATATGLIALSRSNEYNSPQTSSQRRQELADSGPTLAHTTDVLLIVGAAAAATTIILYFKTDWSVAPAPGGATIARRF